MRFTGFRKNVITLATSLLLAMLWAIPAAAQQGPNLFRVVQVEVHNNMVGNFRAGHREVITPKTRELGDPFRYVGRRVLGNTNVFSMISPIPNLAGVNRNLQLSEMEQNYLQSMVISSVASRTQYVMQIQPEMSLPNIGFAGYTIIYRLLVKGDRLADFMELWMEEVIPALDASGVQGTQVYRTVQGGNLNEFWTATSVPALPSGNGGGGGPFSGLGPEGAADLNQRINELTDSVEIYWDRIDEELSYGLIPVGQ